MHVSFLPVIRSWDAVHIHFTVSELENEALMTILFLSRFIRTFLNEFASF
jgi:hypothetical protein